LEGEASLSEAAWKLLGVKEGDEVSFSHMEPLESLSSVRAKIYGRRLSESRFREIIHDILAGRYSDIHLAAFVTACSGGHLDGGEIIALTRAMVDAGDHLQWPTTRVVDKHCVGGLPGNRTTPIVVAIVSACGLTMPKTSSRAITSPAGTADTMETLAPVDLDLVLMRRVVEREGGCIVWGGAVHLSPADDVLIRACPRSSGWSNRKNTESGPSQFRQCASTQNGQSAWHQSINSRYRRLATGRPRNRTCP
jgi:thymidine phosphorylase